MHVAEPILTLNWDPREFRFSCAYNSSCECYETDLYELGTFSISNSGNGNLNWEIQTHEDWITINPKKGVNNKTIAIGINTDVFEESDYVGKSLNGTIYINSNVGTAEGKIYLYLYGHYNLG